MSGRCLCIIVIESIDMALNKTTHEMLADLVYIQNLLLFSQQSHSAVLIQGIVRYVSPEGACASPHPACVAALCHHSPKPQVSERTSGATSSLVCVGL